VVRAKNGILVVGTVLLVAATPARAGAAEFEAGPWIGLLALDPHLADYRWETDARTIWGASALASSGRFGAGARVWRASTRQATGIPGDGRSIAVSLTGFEGLAEAALLSLAGVRLSALGSGGALRTAWSPEELDLGDGGAAGTVVRFEPVTELTLGTGLGARLALPGGFRLAAALERTWFALDTAHRRGDGIVEETEVFGSWTGRVEITRRLAGL
jgi:hypothetical protein